MFSCISNELKIFSILFLIFLFTASGNIDSIDGVTDIFLAKKIVTDQSISFSKKDNALNMPVSLNSQNNRYYALHNAGYAILQIPGILLSKSIRSIFNLKERNFPFESDFIITFWANLTNAIIVALIGLMIYKTTLLILERKKSNLWFLVPLFVVTSNLFVQAHEHFAHPLFSFLFLLSFYYLLLHNRFKKLKYFILFTVFFALTAVSYNVSFVLLVPAIFVFQILENKKSIITVFLAMLPAFFFQLMWNFVRFGNIINTGYSNFKVQILDFSPLHFLMRFFAMLVGPSKGLLIYNPILFFVFAILFMNKKSRYNIFFLVLFVSYLCNYALTVWWHGDATYGPRFFTPIIVIAIIIFMINIETHKNLFNIKLFVVVCTVGLFVQIPGLLIPTFAFPFLSPPQCNKSEILYAFSPTCSPIKVGWSHLLKRRVKETITIIGVGKLAPKIISLRYPDAPSVFRTVYPDPLFDKFSVYKTSKYKVGKQMMNDIYSFTLDVWWIKGFLYKNIFNK